MRSLRIIILSGKILLLLLFLISVITVYADEKRPEKLSESLVFEKSGGNSSPFLNSTPPLPEISPVVTPSLLNVSDYSLSGVTAPGIKTLGEVVMVPITPTPLDRGYYYRYPGLNYDYWIYSAGSYKLGEGISSNGFQNGIDISASNVSLDGNGKKIEGTNTGVYIDTNTSDITIKNFSDIGPGYYGIYSHGDYVSIFDNKIQSPFPIWIEGSHSSIMNNNVSNEYGTNGIYSNGSDTIITGNNADENYIGIKTLKENAQISQNHVSKCDYYGIQSSGDYSKIINNNASISNGGISSKGNNSIILNNNVNHSSGAIHSLGNNTIISENTMISGGTREGNAGIFIFGNNTTIEGNVLSQKHRGIYSGAPNSIIKDNNLNDISWNGVEIYNTGLVDNGYANQILDNVLDNCHPGIFVHSSNKTKIFGNQFINNTCDLYLENDTYGTINNVENGYIYNNYFSGYYNISVIGNFSNYTWTNPVGPQPGTNVMGGPYVAGNYWSNPNGTGWSDLQPGNLNGYTTTPFEVAPGTYDTAPLVKTTTEVSHTINATAGNGGSIEPSGLVQVPHGWNQSFTFTADNGYTINNLTVDGQLALNVSPFRFLNVVSNHTIAVDFKPQTGYIINATAGFGGTITPSGLVNVTAGQNQTFSITPDSKFEISDVIIDGSSVGVLSSYTFMNIVSNHSIHAVFTPEPVDSYLINSTANEWSLIYPNGNKTYPANSNQTFLTQAKPGATISDVQVDEWFMGPIDNWTFTNLSEDHSIHAISNPTPDQIHVFFTATPRYGEMPLFVSFNSSGTLGKPNSWFWQFGDGKTSNESNPHHTYNIPGSYSVTLRALNNKTGGYAQWNRFITVTDGPVPEPTPTPVPGEITPRFTADPDNGAAPLSVQFTNESSGNPTEWFWEFGDGEISTERNPIHIYMESGSYPVKLFARNSFYSARITVPDKIVVQ